MYSVILKKTEQAYSAEKATKARSESTLRNFRFSILRSLDHVFCVIRLF